MLTSLRDPDGARLRSVLDGARSRAAEALARGGLAACHVMSDALDAIVTEIAADLPPGVALLATGGWGRRDTCPRSDIDLLVLTAGAPGEDVRAFAEKLLYPLWDAGLEVGHAVRSLPETFDLTAVVALPFNNLGFAHGEFHRIGIGRCDDYRLRISKATDDKCRRHIRALADAREVIGGMADADRCAKHILHP